MKRVAWLSCAVLALGCSRRSEDSSAPKAAPSEVSSATGSAGVESASGEKPPAKSPASEISSLTLTRRYADQLGESVAIYQGENTVFVGMGARLGRLEEAGVEWLRWIPKDTGFGPNAITGAGGHYPDLYYVTYQSPIARAPAPAFLPLPKGAPSIFSPGGGAGFMSGVAHVGETLLVAGYSNLQGYLIVSAGGKQLSRKQKLPQDAGCKGDELMPTSMGPGRHALEPYAFGATPRGSVVSLGVLCNRRNPTLEVWAPDQVESKFVEIPWRGEILYTEVYPGRDDALWIVDTKGARILRYDSGEVEEVAAPPGIEHATSRDGTLFLHHRDAIYRLDSVPGAKPKLIARLPWPVRLEGFVRGDSSYWVAREGRLYELTGGESTRFDGDCKTPFVYLYGVTPDAPKTYSFPKTRGALLKFEANEKLELLEFEAAGRNVGVRVTDGSTAKALIEHLRKAMPKEQPELICYSPSRPRSVDLKTGKSGSARPF